MIQETAARSHEHKQSHHSQGDRMQTSDFEFIMSATRVHNKVEKNCLIFVRSAPGDDNAKRQLRHVTAQGIELLDRVQSQYRALIESLTPRFGACHFGAADEVRALETTAHLMGQHGDVAIMKAANHALSLKAIAGGAWKVANETRGDTDTQMIQKVAKNPGLLAGQDLAGVVAATDGMVKSVRGLALITGFEVNMSMWAQANGFPETEVGLEYCQAYVVFTNVAGHVEYIIKYLPDQEAGD